MTQSKKIAVTGGIGSGKSVACRIIKEMGLPVFSCDEIYAEIIKREEYVEQVKKAFPMCVVEGAVDRKRLSERVFHDEDERKKLNAIAHPLIMQELFAQMELHSLSVAEVPLLFEEGLEGYFDGVLAITRDLRLRLDGVCKRDGLKEEQVTLRMNRQFPPTRLQEKNCTVIENNGTKDELKEKLENYFRSFGA
ncbi:MAG: dephospho-CoA kinase [Clostridia bacterium]|nr:dephospho-CoA kinase [Clostridia bacterium]